MIFDNLNIQAFNSNEQKFYMCTFMKSFEETFYKSTHKELKDFFDKYKDITKWLIFTDFAFYNKNKQNDVVTFSIIPYIFHFEEYKYILKKLAPLDLKKCKLVNNDFIQFLNDIPILNISIILSKNRKLDFIDEKSFLLQKTQKIIQMFNMWTITTPNYKEKYEQSIKDFTILENELKRKSPNLKVIRDIEIIATLTSYLAYQIADIGNIDILSWFSDRDALISYKKNNIKMPYIIELVSTYYFLFCQQNQLKRYPQLSFGITNDNDDKVWFDEFIRIPDLIAGTIADYNIDKNEHSHKKFIKVSEELLTNKEQNKIFKINFEKKGIFVSKIEVHKQNLNNQGT